MKTLAYVLGGLMVTAFLIATYSAVRPQKIEVYRAAIARERLEQIRQTYHAEASLGGGCCQKRNRQMTGGGGCTHAQPEGESPGTGCAIHNSGCLHVKGKDSRADQTINR